MFVLPKAAEPLVSLMAVAFTRPTFLRFRCLMIGAILSSGRHCLSELIWPLVGLAHGHWSNFYRVFSRAPWSMWPLAKVLAAAVLNLIPAGQVAYVVFDDTLCRHRGSKVYGRAACRDGVRSSRAANVFSFGHRWLVVSILVKPPLADRLWALPVLIALCRTREHDRAEKRRHKTDVDLARVLTLTLARWFPQRRFVALGDGEYGRRELGRDLLRRGVKLVSRLPDNAALYERREGRARGKKLPCPSAAVKGKKFRRVTVRYADGVRRSVSIYSKTAGWSRPGEGFVLLRWVCIRKDDGFMMYLFSTDLSLTPEQIIRTYSLRWAIEVTFQLCREHLAVESPRQRAAKSVLRMTPCLFGLFTLVTLIYSRSIADRKATARQTSRRPWYPKQTPTFSDALIHVRGLIWRSILIAPRPAPRAATASKPLDATALLLRLAKAA